MKKLYKASGIFNTVFISECSDKELIKKGTQFLFDDLNRGDVNSNYLEVPAVISEITCIEDIPQNFANGIAWGENKDELTPQEFLENQERLKALGIERYPWVVDFQNTFELANEYYGEENWISVLKQIHDMGISILIQDSDSITFTIPQSNVIIQDFLILMLEQLPRFAFEKTGNNITLTW
jgi:hypothetical protein